MTKAIVLKMFTSVEIRDFCRESQLSQIRSKRFKIDVSEN